jgi:hypothetical protein
LACAVGNEWYYQYVKASRGRGVTQDLCPTWEYLHRLVRGIWWTAECYFEASTWDCAEVDFVCGTQAHPLGARDVHRLGPPPPLLLFCRGPARVLNPALPLPPQAP